MSTSTKPKTVTSMEDLLAGLKSEAFATEYDIDFDLRVGEEDRAMLAPHGTALNPQAPVLNPKPCHVKQELSPKGFGL